VATLARRSPELGIGLHLTLTLGAPISDPAQVHSLVDADGHFWKREAFIGRLRTGMLAPAEIARECAAQLERLRGLGIEPDHWNVHQHLQEHLGLGAVVARTMFENGVRVARNPRRVRVERPLSPKGALEVARARRRRPGEQAVTGLHRTPGALLDARPSSWIGLLPSLRVAVAEALCHPGEADDAELTALTPGWLGTRAEDLAALLDPRLREFLAGHDVPLTTFARAFPAPESSRDHRGATSL
jgi:predicted glycoside hydrolase/deacetylase ChbG (UPF0249 family)